MVEQCIEKWDRSRWFWRYRDRIVGGRSLCQDNRNGGAYLSAILQEFDILRGVQGESWYPHEEVGIIIGKIGFVWE